MTIAPSSEPSASPKSVSTAESGMESIIKEKGLDIKYFEARVDTPATSANSAGYFATQVPGWDGTNKVILQMTLRTGQIGDSKGRVLWPATIENDGTLYVLYNSKNAVSAMTDEHRIKILYIDT